jgi:CHAD domain-containing protein
MAKGLKVKKTAPLDNAGDAAVRVLRTRVRELYSHWPDPDVQPDDTQLHNQRISGKRLRYSAETLKQLYPDHLALLIDLLKREQDLLGEAQDCVTQRARIATDLARQRPRARRDEIATLEALLTAYDERKRELHADIIDIWRGMTSKRFRKLLNSIVSGPEGREKKSRSKPRLLAVDEAGDEPGTKSVVNIHDGDV